MENQDYRYDSRSQWQSSNLADLDRQQDPASAPPPREEPAEGKSAVDPMGATQDPRSEPDTPRSADAAPSEAAPSAAAITMGGGSVPNSNTADAFHTEDRASHGEDSVAEPSAPANPEPAQHQQAQPVMMSNDSPSNNGDPIDNSNVVTSGEASTAVNGGVGVQMSVTSPNATGGSTTPQSSLDLHADLALGASVSGLIQSIESLLGDTSHTLDNLGGNANLLGDTIAGTQELLGHTQTESSDLLGGMQGATQALLGDLSDDVGLNDLGLGEIGLSDLALVTLDPTGLFGDEDNDLDTDDGDGDLGGADLAGLAHVLNATAEDVFGAGQKAAQPDISHDMLDVAPLAHLTSGHDTDIGALLGGLDGHEAHDLFDLSG